MYALEAVFLVVQGTNQLSPGTDPDRSGFESSSAISRQVGCSGESPLSLSFHTQVNAKVGP